MDSSIPFGGFKDSGWGRVLGKWGLYEYMQPKNIGIVFGKSKVSGWFSLIIYVYIFIISNK